MQTSRHTVLALVLGTCLAGAAHAGTYGDDFGKCLVSASTDADKHQLIEWMFAAIALNPAIAPYSNLTVEKRATIDRNMARLFERLVGEACNREAADALKYEGTGAFETAFELFGQVAGQQLFASPEVSQGTGSFAELIDQEALQKKLGVEPASP